MDIRQATAPRPAPVPEAPFDAPSPARAERPTTWRRPSLRKSRRHWLPRNGNRASPASRAPLRLTPQASVADEVTDRGVA